MLFTAFCFLDIVSLLLFQAATEHPSAAKHRFIVPGSFRVPWTCFYFLLFSDRRRSASYLFLCDGKLAFKLFVISGGSRNE
uniref:Putative secreted protein n=1 Tax=Ixodes ricinus TaxID=34613 RepID=A0A6B0U6K6_IXORI